MLGVTKSGRFAAGVLVAALLLGGCAPADLETAPVSVATKKGTVVCQLYTHEIVYWDRATHVPAGMTPDEGDAVCRQKGAEVRDAEQPK